MTGGIMPGRPAACNRPPEARGPRPRLSPPLRGRDLGPRPGRVGVGLGPLGTGEERQGGWL